MCFCIAVVRINKVYCLWTEMKTAEIYLTLGGRDGRIANVRATEQFYQFSPSSRRRWLEILEVSPFAIREVSDMWTMLRKYEKDGGLRADGTNLWCAVKAPSHDQLWFNLNLQRLGWGLEEPQGHDWLMIHPKKCDLHWRSRMRRNVHMYTAV